MAKGESRTSRVGGTQGSVLASETERTENCRAVYTAQTVKRAAPVTTVYWEARGKNKDS